MGGAREGIAHGSTLLPLVPQWIIGYGPEDNDITTITTFVKSLALPVEGVLSIPALPPRHDLRQKVLISIIATSNAQDFQ